MKLQGLIDDGSIVVEDEYEEDGYISYESADNVKNYKFQFIQKKQNVKYFYVKNSLYFRELCNFLHTTM